MMNVEWSKLIHDLFQRDRAALARLMTHVENREQGWQGAMKRISRKVSPAHVIGITGPPGVGKSSLVSSLTDHLVEGGHFIGILAIDPSSPFKGGAFLGDRIRMQLQNARDEVFIRSMATRGATGGIAQAARDMVRLFGAFGQDIVIIETVGTGQDEVEIQQVADCVCLVCAPGLGDGIQALKAGIMEIADLFVVNKADQPGADALAADIRSAQRLAGDSPFAKAPTCKTIATTGNGMRELSEGLLNILNHKAGTHARPREHLDAEIRHLLEDMVKSHVNQTVDKILKEDRKYCPENLKEMDPYTTAEKLFARIFKP